MVQTEWVSGIDIDEERQTEIQSCFANKVEFHSAKEPDELIDLIEKLKLRTRDIIYEKNAMKRKRFWRKNCNGSSYCYGRRLGYS